MIARKPMDDPAASPDTYWAATAAQFDPVPAFEGNKTAAVAVIGAGFTGLSAALHLAEAGADVIVLDANQPGWGASGRNNGQVVAALKHEPHEIEEAFGAARGRRLMDAIGGGPDLVFSLIERYGMECHATRNGIITAAHSPSGLRSLQERTQGWQQRGAALRMMSRDEMLRAAGTDVYFGGSFDPRGGSVNPLGYAHGLARAALGHGAKIFCGAQVRAVVKDGGGWRLDLASGQVRVDRVIVGTNAYTGDFLPRVGRTFLPARTPQLVSTPLDAATRRRILPGGQVMSDTRLLTIGVRMHPDGRMHMGGGGGSGGSNREGPFVNLARRAREIFPFLGELTWEYRWSGFMAMTPDRYPRLFDVAPGIAASMGYSGRGISMATIMGRELARWAASKAAIDDLVLPASKPSPLIYHRVRSLALEMGLLYYAFKDRLASLENVTDREAQAPKERV